MSHTRRKTADRRETVSLPIFTPFPVTREFLKLLRDSTEISTKARGTRFKHSEWD
jgi:hypothetical protein